MSKIYPRPILVAPLFSSMRAELITILQSLSDDEWQNPTVCEGWNVKDVALHLLGDGINLLSNWRDNDGIWGDVESWDELVDYINTQNDIWVRATRRISRRILLSQLESMGRDISDLMNSADPFAMRGSVGWTGNETDPTWLHIAREYTEYWMHHQHICEAVNRDSLKSREYLHPLISTFVYALPQTYRRSSLPINTCIQFTVNEKVDDTWYIVNDQDSGWQLYAQVDIEPTSVVSMDSDTAWRMFTDGIHKRELLSKTKITGDIVIGSMLLDTIGIIA